MQAKFDVREGADANAVTRSQSHRFGKDRKETAIWPNAARDSVTLDCIPRRDHPALGRVYTSRLCSIAAPMKLANSGCGSKGRLFNSGWYCTPMNQGWSPYSIVSGSTPSGDMPENDRPQSSSRCLYSMFTS